MQQWEYLVLKLTISTVPMVTRINEKQVFNTTLYDLLGEVGKEGWEVCGGGDTIIIIKRPK